MKYFQNLKYAGISILLLVGLGACDKPGPAETAGKNIDQTIDKAGVAIGDAEITTKVKAAIFSEPGLDTLQISVDTVKGVVDLRGSVDSRAYSDTAEALAKEVSGVSQVNNHLAIKPN
jgi:osmotically-inducible protein OsmY